MNRKTFPGQCAGSRDCDKPIVIKKHQMCWNHYTTLYRKTRGEPCSLEWCKQNVYALSLCQYHYHRQRNGQPLVNRKAPKPPCSFEGCGRESKTIGLCPTHYLQQYIGKPLTPIRPYFTREDTNDGRECKTCHEVKDATDFYKRTGGDGLQSECKECQKIRNRRNTLARQAREAALV